MQRELIEASEKLNHEQEKNSKADLRKLDFDSKQKDADREKRDFIN
jgi:hypothetical protein